MSLPGCCESVGVACSTYALSCAVGGFSALAAAAAKHMGITSIIANLLMFALRIGLSSTGAGLLVVKLLSATVNAAHLSLCALSSDYDIDVCSVDHG